MGAGRAFDHVVLAVHDLAGAARIYETLGFSLTPLAHHEDRMGTSNRIAQFQEQNFIELLEVDRPDTLAPHDFAVSPPFFSFGAHNRAALAEREGLSMLVFAGDDARADVASFAAKGVPTYAPFDFERQARLPDGKSVTVAFSLAFATSPDLPNMAFFVCQNRAPEYFWKPAFQSHENGALGIRAIYLSSRDPDRDAAFIGKMFDGEITAVAGGQHVACGAQQEVRVLTPATISELDPSFTMEDLDRPVLAGLAIACGEERQTTPAAAACGAFIEWVRR
ncbi:MAG: VOC family protein [Alphaproteobacteria bacterium]|nr:VOC family protein [Alphaproteobacteria bacterium]